ncbi:MAG: hypothetical protein WCG10_01555 [Chlamydiota bacterium]
MVLKTIAYKAPLYLREQFNNVSYQTDIAKRVALASLPFLKLHSSLKFPVSILTGTMRVWNVDHKDIVGTSVAVISLVSTVFQHRVGVILTTVQNIVNDIKKIQKSKNWEEVSKSLFKISNNLLSLAIMASGGVELVLISSAMQVVLSLIQSRDEFKKDLWIESVANLLMSTVRLRQFYTQHQQFKERSRV